MVTSKAPLDGQEHLCAAAAAAALRARAAASDTTTAGPSQEPDSLSISDAARSISAAKAAVAAAPDIRTDRVSAIKAAIADGSYAVDSRDLAAKLLKPSPAS